MIGLGLQPAGLTGAGTGAASPATPPPIPAQGAPFISSQGNYVIDPATNDIGRTTSARAAVLLALQTTLSTATADTGLGENKPTKVNQSFASDAVASTRRALQSLVDSGMIAITDVQVSVLSHTPGAVSRTVYYTDLLTQAADKVTY